MEVDYFELAFEIQKLLIANYSKIFAEDHGRYFILIDFTHAEKKVFSILFPIVDKKEETVLKNFAIILNT